jgi:hypothetical protein
MKYSNEQIQEILTKSFQFLIDDYNLFLVVNKKRDWGFKLVYKGTKVAISIIFEFRDAYVNIILHRLVNNEIQNDMYPSKPDIALNNIGLDYIVKFKNPSELTKPLYDTLSDYYGKDNAFEIMVSRLSANLRKYASEVLKGNFDAFDEVNGFVKGHYR